jgi:hypothetical protein
MTGAVSSLVGANGQPIRHVPTVLLTPHQARLVRAYTALLAQADLEQELFCGVCGHAARADMAEVVVTASRVAISCGCRLFHFVGPSPAEPVTFAAAALPPGAHRTLPCVILTDDAAQLLRDWRALLARLHFREGLRCGHCYTANRDDGTRASVTSRGITIDCRCRRRVHSGSTIG